MSDVPRPPPPLVWDAENDRFVRPLHCPHCGGPSPVVPDAAREAATCAFCACPYEIVRVAVGEGAGALTLDVLRRPQLAHCSVTGERLEQPSLLDWAQAGGGGGRAGTVCDPRGLLFGEARRDVTWELEASWSTAQLGSSDIARKDEQITSVSVWKGVVVAVTANGLVGLFDLDTGAPLLAHAITWPGVDLEDDDHARAVRLPPALRDLSLAITTDRVALVRDMGPVLSSSQAAGSSRLFVPMPAPSGQQWIGPPLFAGRRAPRLVLARGHVTGGAVADAVVEVRAGSGADLGELRVAIPAPDLARPPAWSAEAGVVVWVDRVGAVFVVDPDAPNAAARRQAPTLPLALRPVERPLLVIVDHEAHQPPELWLADDSDGLKVWRAPLSAITAGAEWAWEPLLETRDVGALRAIAVGPAARAGTSWAQTTASQVFALSTERSTAAFSRALKSQVSDSVLAREPIAPPVLTPAGYLSQDNHGLWLRALPPWSFLDDNPERLLSPGSHGAARPSSREARPGLYDRTFAVVGRQVFYAHEGAVHAARLVPGRARGRALGGTS